MRVFPPVVSGCVLPVQVTLLQKHLHSVIPSFSIPLVNHVRVCQHGECMRVDVLSITIKFLLYSSIARKAVCIVHMYCISLLLHRKNSCGACVFVRVLCCWYVKCVGTWYHVLQSGNKTRHDVKQPNRFCGYSFISSSCLHSRKVTNNLVSKTTQQVNHYWPSIESTQQVNHYWPSIESTQQVNHYWPSIESTQQVNHYWPSRESTQQVNHYWPSIESTQQVNHYWPSIESTQQVNHYWPSRESTQQVNHYWPSIESTQQVNHYGPSIESTEINH